MYFYSDPSRQDEPHSLPDYEVFYRTLEENSEYGTLDGDDEPVPSGWYYWYCFPGCLPDSDPTGPYDTEQLAIADAKENAEGE